MKFNTVEEREFWKALVVAGKSTTSADMAVEALRERMPYDCKVIIRPLTDRTKVILAIKAVRTSTEMGLKEAKEAVDCGYVWTNLSQERTELLRKGYEEIGLSHYIIVNLNTSLVNQPC